MNNRVCTECGRTFQPSSGHLRCPSCRSHNICACGARKQVHSATCYACRDESGPSNGHWRGGRTRHKRGYMMVLSPGHPRADKARYVFEHVLVMEEMLGRYLLAGENVHHRNGVKDDNRPENLELWTRPQPAGIRAATRCVGTRDTRTLREGAQPLNTTVMPTGTTARNSGTRRAAEPSARSATGTPNAVQVFEKTERPWRCRDSNPSPPGPFQVFSERSLLCFSQPRRSRRQDADGLSHCLVS